MIYFDNAATTLPSKNALEYANKFNNEMFYNPSGLYHFGLENNKEIATARETILKKITPFIKDYEVIFTSCGSESDNQAILCCVKKGSYVTSSGEHSAVYKTFLDLKQKNNDVYFAKLNNDGSVDTNDLFNYVKNNRVDFVSIIHVNNETGAINDVNYIADTIKKINPKIIFHADGVQAFGKIAFRLSKNIDFYSISAHKINALKGVGALIKKKTVTLAPLIHGGGQENGYRSGTENIFGIKVLEYATNNHYDNLQKNFEHVSTLKKLVIDNLDTDVFKIISGENSSPYILSVSAVGLRGEVVMHALEQFDIIVGNGSACSSKNRYSRVLKECGYSNDVLDGVIRISFSQDNNIDETKILIEKLNIVAKKLKNII